MAEQFQLICGSRSGTFKILSVLEYHNVCLFEINRTSVVSYFDTPKMLFLAKMQGSFSKLLISFKIGENTMATVLFIGHPN